MKSASPFPRAWKMSRSSVPPQLTRCACCFCCINVPIFEVVNGQEGGGGNDKKNCSSHYWKLTWKQKFVVSWLVFSKGWCCLLFLGGIDSWIYFGDGPLDSLPILDELNDGFQMLRYFSKNWFFRAALYPLQLNPHDRGNFGQWIPRRCQLQVAYPYAPCICMVHSVFYWRGMVVHPIGWTGAFVWRNIPRVEYG